jgi:capsular polysaccharide biosynthesis protein
MENPLQVLIDVLIRRWRVVAAMTVLAMLAAALVNLTAQPTYEATAIVVLSPATLSVPPSNQSPPYYLMVDSPRRLPTAFTPAYYVALLKSISASPAARAAITISPNTSDHSLIEITARSDAPLAAAQAANGLAQAGAVRIQQAIKPGDDEVTAAQKNLDASVQALAKFSLDNGLGDYDLARLQANPSLPSDKKMELERLLRARDIADKVYEGFAEDQASATILATTSYKPTTISALEPTAPISPKPVESVLLGGGLGLVVGILAAFALEYATGRASQGQQTATPIAGR